jgi:hypothetical protein
MLKKNKNSIFLFLLIIFLVTIMGGNSNNPDYDNYEIYYYNYGNVFAPDIGFRFVNIFFRTLGFSYNLYRLMVSILGFYFIYLAARKYAYNSFLVFILFAIYPFLLDVVQIRNFLMYSIVAYAIIFLEEKKYLKYFFWIVIASSIHVSAIIYLPIVIFSNLKKNIFLKAYLLFFIIIGIFIGLNRDLLESITTTIFNFLLQFGNRFESYSSIKTRFGYLLYWLIHLSIFLVLRWSKKIVFSDTFLISKKNKNYVQLVYNLNLYVMLFLPLYVLEITYFRFTRNILFLNYIVFSLAFSSIKNNLSKKILFITIVFVLSFVYFYVSIYGPHLEDIIKLVFEYNWIIS